MLYVLYYSTSYQTGQSANKRHVLFECEIKTLTGEVEKSALESQGNKSTANRKIDCKLCKFIAKDPGRYEKGIF